MRRSLFCAEPVRPGSSVGLMTDEDGYVICSSTQVTK